VALGEARAGLSEGSKMKNALDDARVHRQTSGALERSYRGVAASRDLQLIPP
jgi:hypothetical protein